MDKRIDFVYDISVQENILKMKDEECAILVSAGTTITSEMLYEIEKNAVKAVCSKPKTLRSGCEASSGPILKKKDIHFFSAAETSKSASNDDEDLITKYAALEEKFLINQEELRVTERKSNNVMKILKKYLNL